MPKQGPECGPKSRGRFDQSPIKSARSEQQEIRARIVAHGVHARAMSNDADTRLSGSEASAQARVIQKMSNRAHPGRNINASLGG